MTNYTQIIELAKTLVAQSDAYANRSTKAESARMRKTINEIKKLATAAKQDLITADKA